MAWGGVRDRWLTETGDLLQFLETDQPRVSILGVPLITPRDSTIRDVMLGSIFRPSPALGCDKILQSLINRITGDFIPE